MTDKDEVDALFRPAKDTYGSVDIAFNNAGISPPDDDSILDTELDAWRRVQEVNLTSVYLCCKAALPYMLEQKSRLDHQHRVVRRGDGRGDRRRSPTPRPRAACSSMTPRARRAVRPRGRPRQRAVPRAGEHPAAQGAVRQGRRAGRAPARARADGPLRRAGGDGRAPCCSWPPTSRRSSPRTPSWSTAGSPVPMSPRSETSGPGRDRPHDLPRAGAAGACGTRAPTCCTRSTPTRCWPRAAYRCCCRRRRRPTTSPRAVVARIDALVVSGGADVDPPATARSRTRAPRLARGPRRLGDRAAARRRRGRAADARRVPRHAADGGRRRRLARTSTRPTWSATRGTAPAPTRSARPRSRPPRARGCARWSATWSTVGCHHHQSVDAHPGLRRRRPGPTTARSRRWSGPGHRFCLAVQWHPEVGDDAHPLRGARAAADLSDGHERDGPDRDRLSSASGGC